MAHIVADPFRLAPGVQLTVQLLQVQPGLRLVELERLGLEAQRRQWAGREWRVAQLEVAGRPGQQELAFWRPDSQWILFLERRVYQQLLVVLGHWMGEMKAVWPSSQILSLIGSILSMAVVRVMICQQMWLNMTKSVTPSLK